MAIYHVSKHGSASDSNGGTNATTDAWATLSTHLQSDSSNPKVTAGDTIIVHVGTYDMNIAPGAFGSKWITGTVGNPITIIANGHAGDATEGVDVSSDAVLIRGTGGANFFHMSTTGPVGYYYVGGLAFSGVNMDSTAGGVYLSNDSHHFTMRNCSITQAQNDGIVVETGTVAQRNITFQYLSVTNCGGGSANDGNGIYNRGSYVIFEHITSHGHKSSCCQIRSSTHVAGGGQYNIVRYCTMYGMTGANAKGGVFLHTYADYNEVHNNLIYQIDNGAGSGSGIGLTSGNGGTGNKIYNNTIVDTAQYGIWILYGAYVGTEIKNNVIFDCGANLAAQINNLGTSTVTANNWLGHPSASAPYDNPAFTGYTAGSAWDLTYSGSTPSDILTGGADLGSDYYEDIIGNVRSGTFSMGAYANEVAIPDPPLDPVILYPTPLRVTKNTNKLLTDIQAQDNNDPDVGNYTLRLVLMSHGTLNDGV